MNCNLKGIHIKGEERFNIQIFYPKTPWKRFLEDLMKGERTITGGERPREEILPEAKEVEVHTFIKLFCKIIILFHTM